MKTENDISKSKKKTKNKKSKRSFKKFFKILAIILGVFIIVGLIGNKVWIASGSGQWEKVLEKDGVVVHTLKEPGKFILQMKAAKTINSKLAAFVSVMQDVEAMCTHGCYDARILSNKGSYLLSTFTRFDLPFPMKDREWVLENHFSQDTITKEILYEIHAVPNIVPKNKGFVRIQHFNNTWRFIPKEKGDVEVTWHADMDQGGYIVNLLFNLASADAMRNSFLEIEEMLQDEKYQSATYDFITEVDNKKITMN